MSSNKTNVPEAKSAMNRAKTYRDVMKAKKQELKNAKSAVKEIPYFMNDEKSKIESLMVKFRKTVEMLKMICPDAVGDYVKMLFLDTICANPDRHTFNFGVLRDTDTGEILGLAPNFDNNMALIARGYPTNKAANDLLITLFNELMEKYPEYKEYIPKVTEQTIKKVISKLNMKVKSQVIVDFVIKRYQESC